MMTVMTSIGDQEMMTTLQKTAYSSTILAAFHCPNQCDWKACRAINTCNSCAMFSPGRASAGVEVPTYPQFRDMIRMFMDPIEDPELAESPYLIKKDFAKILELEAVTPGQKCARLCHGSLWSSTSPPSEPRIIRTSCII